MIYLHKGCGAQAVKPACGSPSLLPSGRPEMQGTSQVRNGLGKWQCSGGCRNTVVAGKFVSAKILVERDKSKQADKKLLVAADKGMITKRTPRGRRDSSVPN
jgi:hypothetical protein